MLLWCLCLFLPSMARSRECRISAGRPGGGLYVIAKTLEERLRDRDASLQMRVVPSDGSCKNIEALLEGQVAFALLQYDVASEAVMAGSPETARDLQTLLQTSMQGSGFPFRLPGSWPCLDQRSRSDCSPESCLMGLLPDTPMDLSAWAWEQDLPRSMWMCGVSPWLASQASLKVVAGVGDESIHLLVRSPVIIEDFSDLKPYRIYFGSPGSGSHETAKTILGAAGLVASDLAFLGTWEEAVREITRAQSDLVAMVRTISPGDPEVAQLIRNRLVSLQSLPDEMVRRLIEAHPYFRPCEIPKGTYAGMGPRAVQTVCVDTVLVTNLARLGAPTDDEVEEVLQALEQEQPPGADQASSSRFLLKFREFGDQDRVDLHPVARTRLKKQAFQSWGRLVLVLTALLSFPLLVGLLRKRLRRNRQPWQGTALNPIENPIWPVVSILTLMWASAFAVQQIEQPINPAIQKELDAFWSMASFATGNFESSALKSPWSRFIGILTTLGGLGILAWFTASLTAIFTTKRSLWRRRYAGHVIVINAHEALFRLIEVLRSPGPLRLPIVHIVAKNLPIRLRNRLLRLRGVWLHDLDAEVTADLRLLCPATARRVIVLGERTEMEGKASGQGFHPLRVVRAVRLASCPETESDLASRNPTSRGRALAGTEVNHRVRGSLHPWTVIDADTQNVDDLLFPNIDWLVAAPTHLLLQHLLARASHHPSFAMMMDHLLSYQDCNAEVWTAVLPRSCASWTWRSLRRRLLQASSGSGVVPMGVFRPAETQDCPAVSDDNPRQTQPWLLQAASSPVPGKVLLNPGPEFVLQSGDSLIALAEDEKTLLSAVEAAFPKGLGQAPQ